MRSFRVIAVLLHVVAALVPACANAATVATLYSITGSGDGAEPESTLLPVGILAFGTTYSGGKQGLGSIFSLNQQTGKVTTLYSFAGGASGSHPSAGLVVVGKLLYGTTGTVPFSSGTIFSFDTVTHVLTTIYTGSPTVGDLTAVGGVLYGVTSNLIAPNPSGTLFSLNPATGKMETLYTFDGSNGGSLPGSGLTASGGSLFGALAQSARGPGSIYKFDISTRLFSTIFFFVPAPSSDGANPEGHLAVSGTTVYGTTTSGGDYGYGTVFAIDYATGFYHHLHSFAGGSDGVSPLYGVILENGVLYGVTSGLAQGGPDAGLEVNQGTLFSVNASTNQFTTLHTFSGRLDGGFPEAGLSEVGGLIYGSTIEGGAFGAGNLFSVDPATNGFMPVHAFSGVDEAANPSLLNIGKTLYAVAASGGPAGAGSVTEIGTAHGAHGTLLDFSGGGTGALPNSPLIDLNNKLYGTTAYGGAYDSGTIFSIDPISKKHIVLYSFKGGMDGQYPANLVEANGILYGTTGYLNDTLLGTEFMFDPATGSKTTLYTFTAASGSPTGITPLNGLLYGTSIGGSQPLGTIFQLDPITKTLKTLYSFTCGNDGCLPFAAMIGFEGGLVGTTSQGGANEGGTIFSFNPVTGAVTTLYNFGATSEDGVLPLTSLTSVGEVLYGTTSGGGSALGGTAFQFDTTTNTETVLYSFGNSSAGTYPEASLIDVDGVLYGTTSAGGSSGAGSVFSLTP